METELKSEVQYYLNTDNSFIHFNPLIGKNLHIEMTGTECLNCGLDKPIFRMGYCKECFFLVPQTQDFVLKPELSTAHEGIEGRDLEWEKNVQLQAHIVYLANTGGLKVGVTRKTQLPTRWIDQGATQALPIVEVENRYLAGITEVALSQHVSDKTNYRKMLSSHIPSIDLYAEREKLFPFIPEETKKDIIDEPKLTHIHFPAENIPEKIQSYSFPKKNKAGGVLLGLKGQYLIFENGIVFNVRGNEGYRFSLSFS